MNVYLVGGAVRDQILGKESNDKDYVVVGSTPEEMIKLGYEQVGKDFPVFLHPETKEEYALARKEVKNGHGHTGFKFVWDGVTLEEDLFRRDLTINSIAQNVETGDLIDPYNGIHDIHEGTLKHVSEHFSEDPLRVLRVARFLTKLPNFKVDKDTERMCKKMVKSGELDYLTGERIWKEMEKALSTADPVPFFDFLLFTGALRRFFPELANLYMVPQPIEHHPEGCAWTHVMLVLQKVCMMTDRLDVRFAALVHDLGKGITPNEEWPQHIEHEEKGLPLVEDVCNRFRVPSKFKKLALKVCEFHLRVHRCMEMNAGKVLSLLKNLEAHRNDEFFHGAMLACRADNYGKEPTVEYRQAIFMTIMAEELKSLDLKPVVEKFKGRPSMVEKIQQEQIMHLKRAISRFKSL